MHRRRSFGPSCNRYTYCRVNTQYLPAGGGSGGGGGGIHPIVEAYTNHTRWWGSCLDVHLTPDDASLQPAPPPMPRPHKPARRSNKQVPTMVSTYQPADLARGQCEWCEWCVHGRSTRRMSISQYGHRLQNCGWRMSMNTPKRI